LRHGEYGSEMGKSKRRRMAKVYSRKMMLRICGDGLKDETYR
jgi:hypothetical protein